MIDIISRKLALQASTNSASAVGSANAATIAQSSNRGTAQAQTFAASYSLLNLTGYNVAGDGGHGLYRRVAAQPSHPACFRSADQIMPDGSTNPANGGWWELVPSGSEINVLQLGADPTGATSSDAAFQAAFKMFCTYRSVWTYGDPVSNIVIRVPAGKYLITQSESLIPSAYTTKTTGYCLKGADLNQTNIIFAPTSGSNVMFYNQAFLYCLVEGITFVGTGLAQTFYRADMTSNAQQAWTFRRCNWVGVWGKGFYLTGSNNNSEYTWEDCRGGGQMFQFLYTPPATGTPAGSDQFLNFRFRECHFWFGNPVGGTAGTFTGSITGNVLTVTAVASGTLATGQTVATPTTAGVFGNTITGQQDRVVITGQLSGTTGGVGTYSVINCIGSVPSTTLANLVNDANSLIDMATGGHVHFWGCDFSGLNSGTMFQLRGLAHAAGVCAFTSLQCRVELKSPNTAVLFSEWPQGIVKFDMLDLSSQYSAYLTSAGVPPVSIYISGANTQQPQYNFLNCQLIGKVSVTHATNDYECAKAISIESCDHCQLIDPYQAFVWPGSTNDYGCAPVSLERVRGWGGRLSLQAAWAPATSYAVGQTVRSNNGYSVYKCTTAGTSGPAASAFTGSISGTTLTVSSVASGTIGIGQKITGIRAASVTASTTSASTTITVTAVASGQLAIGQAISGTGIASGATVIAFGTYNGTTGTVTISQAATAIGTGITLTAGGITVLEDTVVTAGSGTSWTVSRSQTALVQALTGTGGPQSAATSIPDGTAVWTFLNNNTRDYFNDGNAISSNFAGTPQRMPSRRRIAEFGGQMPINVSNSFGTQELILPPNALIVGAYAYSPSGAVTEYKATDYLVAFDDGTPLLTISAALASSGFSASATNLMVPIGTGMQKRKVKLIAGGAFGNSVQQYNNQGRVWLEYVL